MGRSVVLGGGGQGCIPLDHVGRERRGLLPEVVECGGEFAVEVARARRLAQQVPLDARDQGRTREVARPHDHDPARRIRDPPRLRVKRIGRAAEVFEFRETHGKRCPPRSPRRKPRDSGSPLISLPIRREIHPPKQLPQGLRRRDAEVIAHQQPHACSGGDRAEEPSADDVEPRGLHERREQVDSARPRQPLREPRPERPIGAGGEREPRVP